ncbi:MAG: phenylalanine--tRNA ligase subunit beta [Candidatus Aenigmarchaeota archaeon]|nr:phenylalanine--tRNA ligase subunit beta [Candidatus Aenigmarchaeota archaeon]
MPTIKVNRKDFCQLVGKNFSMEEIAERIPMLGVAWEGNEGDDFEVEVFPNRPDMLSVEGLARAFSAFMNIKTGLREYHAEQSEYMAIVDPSVVEVRPVFVACVIKDVNLSDEFIKSIIQMQEKLMLTHGRKRKKVAIGLHDLDKIRFPITYSVVNENFSFVPLEQEKEMTIKQILEELPKGKEYGWILQGNKYPIITDAVGKVLSFPPIINSEYTKLETKTRNIFVDITALDEKAANEVLNIIATTFADRGGKIYRVKIKYPDLVIYTPNLNSKTINVDVNYINKILGLSLSVEEIKKYLSMMGYSSSEVKKGILQVNIPCYRTDIMHAFDIVEDVAIAYGYENFEAEQPNIATIGEEDALEAFSNKLRNFLVGYNLQEVLTFILNNKENLFKKMNVEEEEIAETANSKTSEYNVVRNWILPSLMEVLSRNKHNDYPQNIFEVGDVVVLSDNDIGAETIKKLGIVLCHAKASFSEIKSIVQSVLSNLGLNDYQIEELEHNSFIAGRTAKIVIKGRDIAIFGEIHPIVLENWNIEMPVAACEFNVNWLFESVNKF